MNSSRNSRALHQPWAATADKPTRQSNLAEMLGQGTREQLRGGAGAQPRPPQGPGCRKPQELCACRSPSGNPSPALCKQTSPAHRLRQFRAAAKTYRKKKEWISYSLDFSVLEAIKWRGTEFSEFSEAEREIQCCSQQAEEPQLCSRSTPLLLFT